MLVICPVFPDTYTIFFVIILPPFFGGGGGGYDKLCTHIYIGRLGEGPDGVDVVVEDDDAHHDTKTEHDRLLITELGSVVTGITERLEI